MKGKKGTKKKQKYEIVYIPVDVERYMRRLENKKRKEREQKGRMGSLYEQILYKNLPII